MINREALGPQAIGMEVYVSVWASVDEKVHFWLRDHPEILAEYICHGWHENGKKYYEYKIRAASPAKAEWAAEEICFISMYYC